MRLPLLLILPVLLLDILVDAYICRAVWKRCKRGASFWRPVALWSSVLLNLLLVAAIVWPKKSAGDSELVGLMWLLYAYFSIYIPKYFFVLVDLLGCIPRLWHRKRSKVVSRGAIAVALTVFGLMWWGALINRYRIDVREVDVTDPSLPAAFDGFTIAQISDLHVGSYGADTAFVAKVVKRVNELHPDMIVFTGDIVNRRSDELKPFTGTLSRLEAPMGVYSILGNHDYGDYYQWPDSAAKSANMRLLRTLQKDMGWHLLDNDYAVLRAGSDSLVVLGVENIGDPPFPTYGDLDAAYPHDLADPAFKILLSHNPAHWVDDIAGSPDKNIALTLSGHTHAMQIEFFGISPATFRYPTWGGMYTDPDGAHRLYVNIGIGEVGIPARIGATPEITLLTLRK
ncbi:MAG: metallophosphoesterase [Muribaculaceae bacterium]|nr:metallophosphoesterase [Muribaculaceae bacterium]